MYKKDYIIIADTFRRNRAKIRDETSDPIAREFKMQAWYNLLLDFADQLRLTQRNFDKMRFIDWVMKDD